MFFDKNDSKITISKLGLIGSHGFKTSFYNLNPHLWILFVLSNSLNVRASEYRASTHVGEGVKMHDIHIKPKYYKLELLGELGPLMVFTLVFFHSPLKRTVA